MHQPTIITGGYGLLIAPEFVEVLFGRRLKESERTTRILEACQLRIVPKQELLFSPIISNDEYIPQSFRLYGLTTTGNEEDRVLVRPLELSTEEQALVHALNFEDDVFFTQAFDYKNYRYVIDLLKDPSLGCPTQGLDYNPVLNGTMEDAISLAYNLRDSVVQKTAEGNGSNHERR